jgi:hypothetical protein
MKGTDHFYEGGEYVVTVIEVECSICWVLCRGEMLPFSKKPAIFLHRFYSGFAFLNHCSSGKLKSWKSLLFMAYRKICNVITVTKHYISGNNSQRLKSYGLFCQLRFAKLSTAKFASFDDIRKGNLHNEKIIFVIKSASLTN